MMRAVTAADAAAVDAVCLFSIITRHSRRRQDAQQSDNIIEVRLALSPSDIANSHRPTQTNSTVELHLVGRCEWAISMTRSSHHLKQLQFNSLTADIISNSTVMQSLLHCVEQFPMFNSLVAESL